MTANTFPNGSTRWPDKATIIEVGPRDGLQRVALIPTEDKLKLVERLIDAGLTRIQVTSFVHPKYVPQMADAEEMFRQLPRNPQVHYSALALNLRGVERAVQAGLAQVDISVSANENHSRRNANRSIEESMAEFEQMVAVARGEGLVVRGGIQCVFGYEQVDDVDQDDVLRIVQRHLDLGVDELALADSAGFANPRAVSSLISQVKELAGETPIILHLHDTRGMGLANVLAALSAGVSHFDTSFGGLGGCPFIDNATGNISTEDTVYMLEEMGIRTGVDLGKVSAISRDFEAKFGLSLNSKLYNLVN